MPLMALKKICGSCFKHGCRTISWGMLLELRNCSWNFGVVLTIAGLLKSTGLLERREENTFFDGAKYVLKVATILLAGDTIRSVTTSALTTSVCMINLHSKNNEESSLKPCYNGIREHIKMLAIKEEKERCGLLWLGMSNLQRRLEVHLYSHPWAFSK